MAKRKRSERRRRGRPDRVGPAEAVARRRGGVGARPPAPAPASSGIPAPARPAGADAPPASRPAAGAPSRPRLALPPAPIVVVFSVTLVLSSSLLFLVQPMFARLVLPLLGSAPAVWTTAMLFFQATLLAGYLYAHVSTRALGARRQAALHLAVLLLPLLVLPIAVPGGWDPPTEGTPVLWLLALLAVAVGLPFFAVSATAPLLQAWLANTRTPAARDPYFLYWASNLGSILGLLAYPLLLEPALGLAEQGRAWAIGYAGFLACMAASALMLRRSARPERRDGGEGAEGGSGADVRDADGADAPGHAAAPEPRAAPEPLTGARRVRWVALAFAPSSLLLGVTAFLSTDLAPVPLLWVVPLALYLLTFVVAFSGTGWALPSLLRAPAIWVAAFAMILPLGLKQPLALLMFVHLGTFFVVALACHTALARDRPATPHLTAFYLWLSLGGALGGAFNAIVAPHVFDTALEYPLAVVLGCLLLAPAADFASPWRTRRLDVALPLGLAVAVAVGLLAAAAALQGDAETLGRFWVLGFAGAALLAFARRPVRLGLGVAAVLAAAGAALADEERILTERSFFGVHRVQVPDGTQVHQLVHGTTVHGAQDRRRPTEPLTYYHRSGPLGDVFRDLPDRGPRRAAVVGLGTGTIACHGRPGERWTFFEIDPVVRRIAQNPKLFTYLRDCPPRSDVVLGDARLSLARRPAREFDLLVADAFSSDAIPVHLMTREALDLYAARLSPGGVILFNVSNRYLELEPVLGNLAADRGMSCVAREHDPAEAERTPLVSGSHWLALAATPADLGRLPAARGWHGCARDAGARPWTDDYSNLLSAL